MVLFLSVIVIVCIYFIVVVIIVVEGDDDNYGDVVVGGIVIRSSYDFHWVLGLGISVESLRGHCYCRSCRRPLISMETSARRASSQRS